MKKIPFTIICTYWAGQYIPDRSTLDQQRVLGAQGVMNVSMKTWQHAMLTLTAHAPTDGDGGIHPAAYAAIEQYMKRLLITAHGRDNISGLEITIFEPIDTQIPTPQS